MTEARAAVQSLLDSNADLNTLGFDSVWAGNSIDSPPQNRFIVLRWEEATASFGQRGRTRLTVWFHDTDRDYGGIQQAMQVVRDVLEGAVHVLGADGVTLTTAKWDEDSSDLFDDGYGTVTKWSGFTVVARR